MSRQPRGPRTKDIEKELAGIGGESLDGSGFEEETPQEGFTLIGDLAKHGSERTVKYLHPEMKIVTDTAPAAEPPQ